jgi:hypothetical protein
LEWWHDPDTTSVVTVGVGLLAVPTAFGVFGEISRWSLWVRVPIGAAWLIVAVLVVVRQHPHDKGVDQLVEGWRMERADEAVLAAQELLSAFLVPGLKGTPASFRWSVHVYDEERYLLLAPLESAGAVLGTLSAISLEDDEYFESEPGPAVLRDAAGVVATLLLTMIGPGELRA